MEWLSWVISVVHGCWNNHSDLWLSYVLPSPNLSKHTKMSKVRRGRTGKAYTSFLSLKRWPEPPSVFRRNKSGIFWASPPPLLFKTQGASVGLSIQTPLVEEISKWTAIQASLSIGAAQPRGVYWLFSGKPFLEEPCLGGWDIPGVASCSRAHLSSHCSKMTFRWG